VKGLFLNPATVFFLSGLFHFFHWFLNRDCLTFPKKKPSRIPSLLACSVARIAFLEKKSPRTGFFFPPAPHTPFLFFPLFPVPLSPLSSTPFLARFLEM